MRKRHLQHGFTLGETLTALAVVGISLSVGVPALDALVDGNRRTTTVNQFVGTLHLARSAAVTRNRPVTVCASADGERCTNGSRWEQGWIAFLDDNSDGIADAGEVVLDSAGPLAGVTVNAVEPGGTFDYLPSGRAVRETTVISGGRFLFCAPGETRPGSVIVIRSNGTPFLVPADTAASPSCPNS